MTGWILRTLKTRGKTNDEALEGTNTLPTRIMSVLTSSLWAGETAELESVQLSLTARTDTVRNLNYWERLKAEAIRSRAQTGNITLVFTWKNLVPNLHSNILPYCHNKHERLKAYH